VLQIKITLSIPKVLVERVEEYIKKRGSATSVADFMRQATNEKIDRLEREERGDREPVDISALGDPTRAARRR
jgi:metal-responsive CopG/Arc/MetJ family transcriptional regulator